MAQAETPNRSRGPVMGVFEHADELRARLMRCLMIFMAGFVGFYWVTEPILAFLRRPLFAVLPPERQQLYFTSLFENFLTHLKVAGYASLIFLSPLYFHQVWGFVSPGLYQKEKRWVLPFALSGALFFALGAAFAYSVLFPVGFKYFVQYGAPTDVPLLTISAYYETCLKLMLLFGLSFELPVVLVFMGWMGWVSPAQLREHRKTAILLITILSALFAPPDAVSMLLLMAPLILMFEGAIGVISWIQTRRGIQGNPQGKSASGAESGTEPNDPWRGRSISP
ncbi:MAG: hypothetical protein RJB38_937 [Pseudomonadota bacterium]|jgi:sec-independent protein translocase protein TatC